MGDIRKRSLSIGLQHQMIVAVFIIVLSAVYLSYPTIGDASSANRKAQAQNQSRPSNSIDGLMRQFVPPTPKMANCASEKCIALTFDDGPEPSTTPEVLNVLKAQATPATFFVLGIQVQKHPDILRRIHAEGHEIGGHSWGHKALTKMKPQEIQAELDMTVASFQNAGVEPPKIFRPPYGMVNSKVKDLIKQPIILWNIDPHDWATTTGGKQEIADLMATIKPGAIVLLHDIKPGTARSLDEMISSLRQAGYRLVTVSQLLELNDTSTGVYYGRY